MLQDIFVFQLNILQQKAELFRKRGNSVLLGNLAFWDGKWKISVGLEFQVSVGQKWKSKWMGLITCPLVKDSPNPCNVVIALAKAVLSILVTNNQEKPQCLNSKYFNWDAPASDTASPSGLQSPTICFVQNDPSVPSSAAWHSLSVTLSDRCLLFLQPLGIWELICYRAAGARPLIQSSRWKDFVALLMEITLCCMYFFVKLLLNYIVSGCASSLS